MALGATERAAACADGDVNVHAMQVLRNKYLTCRKRFLISGLVALLVVTVGAVMLFTTFHFFGTKDWRSYVGYVGIGLFVIGLIACALLIASLVVLCVIVARMEDRLTSAGGFRPPRITPSALARANYPRQPIQVLTESGEGSGIFDIHRADNSKAHPV